MGKYDIKAILLFLYHFQEELAILSVPKMSKGQLLLFAFVCAAFVWQEARSSPARAIGYNSFSRDVKIPRTIRAPFRNREMMTARGFGKRSQAVKYKEGERSI